MHLYGAFFKYQFMLPIRKITILLLCILACSSAFSQTADSAATLKLVERTWAPDSVVINHEKQDASKSAGAKMAFNKDFSMISTDPDGSEEQGTWKYDAASNSIIMKQGEEDVVFKIISVSEKSLVLAIFPEGLPEGVKIYLSPAKE